MSGYNSKKNKGFRKTSNRLYTAKGRKLSSTKWLTRHINDKYVMLAKQNKYRSRAAFKLLEILEKFELLNSKTKNIIDLGCAPGSWLQVLGRSKFGKNNKLQIVGVDLQEMEPVEGIEFVLGDFLVPNVQSECASYLNDSEKFDIILSDMAAKSCGNAPVDHLRIMQLAESVLQFAEANLRQDGHLVLKILRGEKEHEFHKKLQIFFTKVKYFKPDSSYKDSAEIYVVARFFKNTFT